MITFGSAYVPKKTRKRIHDRLLNVHSVRFEGKHLDLIRSGFPGFSLGLSLDPDRNFEETPAMEDIVDAGRCIPSEEAFDLGNTVAKLIRLGSASLVREEAEARC